MTGDAYGTFVYGGDSRSIEMRGMVSNANNRIRMYARFDGGEEDGDIDFETRYRCPHYPQGPASRPSSSQSLS